ncbi:hypothetical protein PILCRDRAFT_828136 [Piloderma croceum F 1598]|uniref:Uncharacterized protein n=1 Tax=Piloderma croceum (strain F 1598) TaxID=765440 RepID=A0A0C3EPX5_PILCF|nr:hypothetical protein PILCRDRAFT_828136 [Piloderma croceum F 1598]
METSRLVDKRTTFLTIDGSIVHPYLHSGHEYDVYGFRSCRGYFPSIRHRISLLYTAH